jgi:hypothetical protein
MDPGPGVTSITATPGGVLGKYNPADGSLVWAREVVSGISVAPIIYPDPATGAIYCGVNAYTVGTVVDLNPAGPGGEYTNAASPSGYMAKLDSAGNFLTSWTGGGSAFRPIRVDGGTIYTVGWFTGTSTFPTGDTLTSHGDRDIYIMALDDPAPGPLFAVRQTSPPVVPPVAPSTDTGRGHRRTSPTDPFAGVFLGGVAVDGDRPFDSILPADPTRGRSRF